jgi:hypothetical protein
LTVSHKNYNFMNFLFQICFMSVNDIVGLVITSDSEQSSVSLPH